MTEVSEITEAVLLAGGLGTRLRPFTHYTSKHLLPVFELPMIFYPLKNLQLLGIKEVFLIVNKEHVPQWESLLSAYSFQMSIKLVVQDKPLGIPAAISLCRLKIKKEKFLVALGDNIIIASEFIRKFRVETEKSANKAVIVGFSVPDPRPFGVARFHNEKLTEVVEKPEIPPSDLAIVGLYMFSRSCFEKIEELDFSARGELEIADLINSYLAEEQCILVKASDNANDYWLDTGTITSINMASQFLKHLSDTTGKQFANFAQE